MGSRIHAQVVAVTALGMALAACSNSSDPVGNVAAGPATGEGPSSSPPTATASPQTLQLPASEAVTIQITNSDQAAHLAAVPQARHGFHGEGNYSMQPTADKPPPTPSQSSTTLETSR